MTSSVYALQLLSCALVVLGTGATTYTLVKMPAAPRPTLGARGRKRAEALARLGLLSVTEPWLRYVAARISGLPFGSIEVRLRRTLEQSGDYLGLTENELIAASLLSSAFGGLAALLVSFSLDLPAATPLLGLSLGLLAPWYRVRAVARQRTKYITRSLPGVIELVAMCMGAGLDFPGSLRRVVTATADANEPILEELRRVLGELDLGRSRRAAMVGFSDRVPSDEVRELANSVIQAEDKGTPIARVLTIQAQTLRLRRSIAAEETASGAALMLIGPMTLIFLCVIVLLLAPVVVRFATGGFQAA